MSSHKIAIGFNNASNMTEVIPQPVASAVYFSKIIRSLSGKKFPDGWSSLEWIYKNSLTPEQLQNLLTQFGLGNLVTAEVTVFTLDNFNRNSWNTYNALIHKPEELEFRLGFWRDVIFKLDLLEKLV